MTYRLPKFSETLEVFCPRSQAQLRLGTHSAKLRFAPALPDDSAHVAEPEPPGYYYPMRTLELTLQLPDQLAREAEATGLLKPEAIEHLLR